MDITLLGVGEAFDAEEPNSCALVEADGYTLLIDCGHSAVGPVWRACPDADRIDAIFITHHHADHVLGLVPVLDRWAYEGRRKPLTILTSADGRPQLQALLTAGFVPWDARSPYPIDIVDAQETERIGPFLSAVAPTRHAIPNYALRLEHGGRRFAYSGDGRPTAESLAMYAGTDLLLHECFATERADELPFHCDLPTASAIRGVKRIGLYHIKAGARVAMRRAIDGEQNLFVPDAGTQLVI